MKKSQTSWLYQTKSKTNRGWKRLARHFDGNDKIDFGDIADSMSKFSILSWIKNDDLVNDHVMVNKYNNTIIFFFDPDIAGQVITNSYRWFLDLSTDYHSWSTPHKPVTNSCLFFF